MTITTNDGGSGGDFRFFGKGHVEFWDTTSSLIINGDSYHLMKNIRQIAHAVRRHPWLVALAKSYNAAHDGTYSSAPIPELHTTFEGLGNTISNLTIVTSQSTGLFGVAGTDSSDNSLIRDIGLTSVNFTIDGFRIAAGALASGNGGRIENSYATGQIVALHQGCCGAMNVLGGLVGVGGAGSQFSSIMRSYAAVDITGSSDSDIVGGLIGKLNGECFGACSGTVQDSYATGSVTTSDNGAAGGLVGINAGGTILDCYATGTVVGGTTASVGGLVGSDQDLPSEEAFPNIFTSYSTGAVSSGAGASIGGLLGQDVADSEISNAYWDLDTSGISDPTKGAGNIANDPGITGLSDAQLKSGLPAGFDKKVREENAAINGGYPYLIANPPQ